LSTGVDGMPWTDGRVDDNGDTLVDKNGGTPSDMAGMPWYVMPWNIQADEVPPPTGQHPDIGSYSGTPQEANRAQQDIGPPQDSQHADLVRRVKTLQRKDEVQRRQWWRWCEAMGEGVRDPRRHTSEFLHEFLQALATDNIPKIELRSERARAVMEMNAPNIEGNTLEAIAARIKLNQRQSHDWKKAWWRYCDRFASGVRDPMRHDVAFLLEFLKQNPPDDGGSTTRADGAGDSSVAAVVANTSELAPPIVEDGAGASSVVADNANTFELAPPMANPLDQEKADAHPTSASVQSSLKAFQ